MALYVIDTNILIRLVTNDVPALARQAEAKIAPLGDNMIDLPLYVLSEAVYVLAYNQHYQYSRQRITDSLFALISIPQFQLNRGLVGQTLNTFNHSKLDFVDCLLLCQSTQAGQSILTFDKELRRKAEK
jgi:predicted nucleic-acid-binding protein